MKIAILLLSLSACGNAAAPNYTAPVGEVKAVITSSLATVPDKMSVAIYWKLYSDWDSSDFVKNTLQSTGATAVYPDSFSVEVESFPANNGKPVPSAMGYLVAYQDNNVNGVLDCDGDTVLCLSTDAIEVFTQQDSSEPAPVKNIGVLYLTHPDPLYPNSPTPFFAEMSDPAVATSPIKITLTGDASLQTYACP